MYEKWEELEHQFRAETQQDAPPFGPGVVEWDYSRYTRALGFGKSPGLDTLPRRGCAIVAGRPDFWDAAADHFEKWGESIGWDVLRVSARPSTVVPDPTIYQLGIEITHPDSLIFCAAGQQGEPALGKRPRSPAMRIPLSSTERWLIAADRVRRRLRTEIATRGLIICIDEAHLLTPNALTTLCYLLDAQCAWRSHLLSSPAQIYVAFSIPAHTSDWFHKTLQRFSPLASPFRATEPQGPRKRPEGLARVDVSVEDEHVLSTLRECGLDVPIGELELWFGESPISSIRRGVSDGSLQHRTMAGVETLGVRDCGQRGQASFRALDHVARSIASRASPGRAQRHLRVTVGLTEHRLGNVRRSQVHWAKIGSAEAATAPLYTASVVLEILAESGSELHARLGRAMFCMAAQSRRYSEARKIAKATGTRGVNRLRDCIDLVASAMQIGHSHAIACVPSGLWSDIHVQPHDSIVAEAFVILAETFVRLGELRRNDVTERCDALRTLLPAALHALEIDPDTHMAREATRLLLTIASRLDSYAAVCSSAERSDGHQPLVPESRHQFDLCVPSSGYVSGAAGGLHRMGFGAGTSAAFPTDSGGVRDCILTAGYPENLVPELLAQGSELNRGGLRLLSNGLVDEVLLLGQNAGRPRWRMRIARLALASTPVSLSPIALQQCARTLGRKVVPLDQTWDRIVTVTNLLRLGSPELALESTRFANDEDPGTSKTLLIFLGCIAALRCPIGSAEDELRRKIRREVPLDRSLSRSPAQFIMSAIRDAMAGRWMEAEAALVRLCAEIDPRSAGPNWMMFVLATEFLQSVRIAKSIERTADSVTSRNAGRRLKADLVRGASEPPECINPRHEPFVVMSRLEVASRCVRSCSSESVVELGVAAVAFFVSRWDWSIVSAVKSIERNAPRFYGALRQALDRSGCLFDTAGSSLSSVATALSTVSSASEFAPAGRRSSVEIRGRWGRRKTARLAARSLSEDGTGFAWILGVSRTGSRRLRRAAQIGRGGGWRASRTYTTTVRRHRQSGWAVLLSASRTDGERSSEESLREGRGDVGAVAASRDPMKEHDQEFIGASPAFVALEGQIARAASCAHPVLIIGETGTGKELIARRIHELSARGSHQLVIANCGAIPESLVERELFGHCKGAFSGAVENSPGLVEEASAGTLFLDEIDSAPRRMQATLLRVLDSGEYRSLGGTASKRSDFRLVAAALPRIRANIATGDFRQDLYYRISTLVIDVPPLRKRGLDIGMLACQFANQMGASLTPNAMTELGSYHWPGNVRELRHAVVAMALQSAPEPIRAELVRRWVQAQLSVTPERRRTTLCTAIDAGHDQRSRCDAAIQTLSLRGKFSSGDVIRVAGVPRRTVQRELASKVSAGELSRHGAGRGTQYEASNGSTD